MPIKVSDEDRAVFEREWARGTSTKRIGIMLDPPRSVKTLCNWRYKWKLPLRERKRVRYTIHVIMSSENYADAVRKRAAERGMSLSAHIRDLIKKDLERA